jgi:FKBP-type peptidyl-prolyl cis-trans isomerase 2
MAKARLGSGSRLRALERKIGHKHGVRNPGAVAAAIGRKKYGKARYAVGEVVQFPTPDGLGQYAGSVQRVGKDGDGDGKSDAVLFDFNHPLAGQPVTFEVQVIGVL